MANEDRGGRPTEYSAEKAEKILGYIRGGCHRETAAAAAGITTRTLRTWLKAAAEGREPYAGFELAMAEADAQAEARDVLLIGSASKEDWRAAAFRLSRRWPERWKEQTGSEISGPGGGPVSVDARTALLDRLGGLVRGQDGEGPPPEAGGPERRD